MKNLRLLLTLMVGLGLATAAQSQTLLNPRNIAGGTASNQSFASWPTGTTSAHWNLFASGSGINIGYTSPTLTFSNTGIITISIGNLSPLFTSSGSGTNPYAITYSLSNAAGTSWFGNASGSSGTPSYNTGLIPVSLLGSSSGSSSTFLNGTGAFSTPSGGGSLTVTDGTHSVSSTTTLTFNQGTVGGSAGSATYSLPAINLAAGGAGGVTGLLPTTNGGNGVSNPGTSGHIVVGQGSTYADKAISGDSSITSGGTMTNTGIQGVPWSATAPTTNQVPTDIGGTWTPTSLNTLAAGDQLLFAITSTSSLTNTVTSKQTFTMSPSCVIPANQLVAGQIIEFRGALAITSSALSLPSSTYEVDFGGTSVATFPATTMAASLSSGPAILDMIGTVLTTGSSGTIRFDGKIIVQGVTSTTPQLIPLAEVTSTVNTTTTNTVTIADTFSSMTQPNTTVLGQFGGILHAIGGISGGGSSSLPTDYISGCTLAYDSTTAIYVNTGTAYVPGISSAVTVTSKQTLTPTLSASTLYYVYLDSATPTFTTSSTAPATNYQGTAWKDSSGDRYIGSFLTNASSQIINFQRIGNEVHYRSGQFASPFSVLSNGSATTSTSVSCSSVIPPTSTLGIITATMIYSSGATAGTSFFGSSTGLTPTTSTGENGMSGQSNASYEYTKDMKLNLNAGQAFLYCNSITSIGLYCSVIGYDEDR